MCIICLYFIWWEPENHISSHFLFTTSFCCLVYCGKWDCWSILVGASHHGTRSVAAIDSAGRRQCRNLHYTTAINLSWCSFLVSALPLNKTIVQIARLSKQHACNVRILCLVLLGLQKLSFDCLLGYEFKYDYICNKSLTMFFLVD